MSIGEDAFTVGEEPVAASAIDAPATYVVKIKNQSYAVGLLWDGVDDPSRAAAEAREHAARPRVDADLFAIRSNNLQFGLGFKANGHAKNMTSLAGALADGRNGSWVGVFEVAGGFYVIAVRDDGILATTDVYVANEVDARARFDELLYMEGWNAVYAPAGFDNASGATELAIEEALGRARGPRLQDVDRVGSLTKWVGAVIVVALLAGGGMFYLNWQQQLDWQRQLDEAAKNFNNVTGAKKTVVIPPMPWEGKPLAVNYLTACLTALDKAVLNIPGWRATGLMCDGDSVHLRLARDGSLGEGGGPISWIRWALDQSNLHDASAAPVADNEVEVSWPISDVEKSPVSLKTPRVMDGRRFLQTEFENTFTPIVFPIASSTQFVTTQQFKFSSRFEPTEFAAILGKIPGMTIERVIVDLSKFEYSVEGSIYEQLPLPADVTVAAQ